MKVCPKCYKTYDDSWGKCLGCDVPLKVTTQNQQDDLSFDAINALFDKDFIKPFFPSERFYDNWNPTDERLSAMMREILRWLKLDDVPPTVRYVKGMNVPGIYTWQGDRSEILVDEKYRKDPFQVGAILAHECMHHYMKKNALELSDVKKNELKTDLATICCGLGIVVINGMSYRSHWYLTIILLFFGRIYVNERKRSFGYYEARDYCGYFNRYLRSKGMDGSRVIGFIHPQARSFLPKEISNKKAMVSSGAIASQEKRNKRNLIVQIIAVILGASLVVTMYYCSAKVTERDNEQIAAELQSMKKQIDEVANKFEQAKSKLRDMRKEAEYYKAIGDPDSHNKIAVSYEELAAEAQKYYNKHQWLVRAYNDKIAAINKGRRR